MDALNKKAEKAIVLLSAGLDCLVSLAMALEQGYDVQAAMTINYGQEAAEREIAYASRICEHYGIVHQVVDVRGITNGIMSGLTTGDIPEMDGRHLDDLTVASETARKVWFPNRNGFFINLAAMYAENTGCTRIITGFNEEEAATFPDNSADFVEAINQSLQYSTSNHVQVISLTQDMRKTEIAGQAVALNVPMALIWSCYHGEEQMCGTCESCQRLRRAFAAYPQISNTLHFVHEVKE